MLIRRQTLLLFFLCGWLPAVALGCLVAWLGQQALRSSSEQAVAIESERTARQLRAAIVAREHQLTLLARSSAMVEYLKTAATQPDTAPLPAVTDSFRLFDELAGGDLRGVYGFGADQQPLFAGERTSGINAPLILQRTHTVPNIVPDRAVWTNGEGQTVSTLNSRNGVVRYLVPVAVGNGTAVVVADVSLDSLLRNELGGEFSRASSARHLVIDQQGTLLSEVPTKIRYQPVENAYPDLKRMMPAVTAGPSGAGEIFDQGNSYQVGYFPVGKLGLTYVVLRDPPLGHLPWWWFLIALGVVTAAFLAFVRWHQTALRQDRLALANLTRSAAEIAEGKVTKPVAIEASPPFQKLFANFNLMTEKLREQIAREAEARQFQSFLRLSATITHDLKNAIQALSLLVSNMEAHFDDPEFRAHAIQGLTRSTETLNGLIARLSEPMRSLSGEMPRPQPIDLVPMLKGVLRATAEQDRAGHELQIDLPDKLIVAVDAERIEKVFENLIINALQAMDKKKGTLTVTATTEGEKCTVSVSDTGVGMTEEFIRERLFRAFNTTKPLGIGLGLYTCREVIRAHGGTITAESEKGSGTTFRVVLPLRARALWVT